MKQEATDSVVRDGEKSTILQNRFGERSFENELGGDMGVQVKCWSFAAKNLRLFTDRTSAKFLHPSISE